MLLLGMLACLCDQGHPVKPIYWGCAGAWLTDKELLRAGYNLRGEVCREMVLRREEIEPFITGIFDAYVEAMALEGCWGGKPHTLIIMCHRHRVFEHAAHVQMETRDSLKPARTIIGMLIYQVGN